MMNEKRAMMAFLSLLEAEHRESESQIVSEIKDSVAALKQEVQRSKTVMENRTNETELFLEEVGFDVEFPLPG